MNNMTIAIDRENLPTVALVGRVNVGKSTLFNRLIEEQKAIVSPIPGTTRTNNVGVVLWRGKSFRLVDTGGLTFTDDVPLEGDIVKQSERAMKEADIIVFVTDAHDGVLPQETELAKRLRRVKTKPVLLVANKVDSNEIEMGLTEPAWMKLGLGEPFAISAASGRRLGDFLDLIYKHLRKIKKQPKIKAKEKKDAMSVSIIGKPNVGKSSLFNKLIGAEHAIVSDMPHTTREPHDTLVTYEYTVGKKTKKQHITFVDTAGIRRKTKVSGGLEGEGIRKSIHAIDESDIVLLVLDVGEPISSQDMQLGGLLERHSRSVIILLNKWDLVDDTSDHHRNEVAKKIFAYFPHLAFAELLFVSGKSGYRVHQIYDTLLQVSASRHKEVPQDELTQFLKQATSEHRPMKGKGTHHPRLVGLRQVHVNPPIFELFIKAKTSVHRSYVNFLERKMRERFHFIGTPLVIRLTKMKK